MSLRPCLKITLIGCGPIGKAIALYPACASLKTAVRTDLLVLRPLEPTQTAAVIAVPAVIELVGTVVGKTVFERLKLCFEAKGFDIPSDGFWIRKTHMWILVRYGSGVGDPCPREELMCVLRRYGCSKRDEQNYERNHALGCARWCL